MSPALASAATKQTVWEVKRDILKFLSRHILLDSYHWKVFEILIRHCETLTVSLILSWVVTALFCSLETCLKPALFLACCSNWASVSWCKPLWHNKTTKRRQLTSQERFAGISGKFEVNQNGMLITRLGRVFYKLLLWHFGMMKSLIWSLAWHYHACLQARACKDGNKCR